MAKHDYTKMGIRDVIKSKRLGSYQDSEHLVLDRQTSDISLPGKEYYMLRLVTPAPEPSSIPYLSISPLLVPPEAIALSLSAYDSIFEAIRSRHDFEALRQSLSGKVSAAWEDIAHCLKKRQ